MKFIFFGTPKFAAIVLEKLLDAGFVPQAVVCNPDRPQGRKQLIMPPPIKSLIQERDLSIPIFQPEDSATIRESCAALNPDFFIVAAYAQIIPQSVLGIPSRISIGVHPSLLPKYRGASPIHSALLAGDTESGVTLYLMDEKMDHGPILGSRELRIEDGETYETLLKKLAVLGGELLIETLPKFLSGDIRPQEQDHSQATFTKKFTTEDGFIVEHDLLRALRGEGTFAAVIDRKIRTLNPEPSVWTIVSDELGIMNNELRSATGKRVKLLEAEIQDGKLVLRKIQIEGKTPQRIDLH